MGREKEKAQVGKKRTRESGKSGGVSRKKFCGFKICLYLAFSLSCLPTDRKVMVLAYAVPGFPSVMFLLIRKEN